MSLYNGNGGNFALSSSCYAQVVVYFPGYFPVYVSAYTPVKYVIDEKYLPDLSTYTVHIPDGKVRFGRNFSDHEYSLTGTGAMMILLTK